MNNTNSMQRFQSNSELIRWVTEAIVADGLPHKAGELYERFHDKTNGVGVDGSEISRKAFEMCLRNQVVEENGCLKRLSFGVYQKRECPDDRGILYSRRRYNYSPSFDDCDSAILEKLMPQAEKSDEGLHELLDDSLFMFAGLKNALSKMTKADTVQAQELSELRQIQAGILKNLDCVITGITAAIAWQEDYLEQQDEEEHEDFGMQFGY